MPETSEIVINTGPVIALVAALGDLEILDELYERVVVPREVSEEILVEGGVRFGAAEFEATDGLSRITSPTEMMPYLRNSLDSGEAAVIQVALNEGVHTVCIDEPAGRRVARLCGLQVTGSLGILVRGKRAGCVRSVSDAIEAMKAKGVYLSSRVVNKALEAAGEL
jgi:predicted nucleic acid-binding protein